MTSAYAWVLTISVLGNPPVHKTFDKYSDQQSCLQALQAARQQYKAEGRQIIGACTLTLKEKK